MRILHVVHGFAEEAPGGTELHVRDLSRRQSSSAGGGHATAAFARTRRPDVAEFAFVDDGVRDGVRRFAFNHLGVRGRSFAERDDLPAAVAAFALACDAHRPDVVHVHHLAGLSFGILGEAKRRGARVVFTTHDHAAACPRGRRIRLDLEPCPVLDRARCARCVRPAWIEAARSPDRVRAWLGILRPGEHRRLFARRDALVRAALAAADVVLAPSDSAADLLREFFDPGARLRVVPHGSPPAADVAPPTFPTGRSAVFGFFGAAHPNKGARTAAEALGAASDVAASLQVHGAVDEDERARLTRLSGGRTTFSGAYAPEEASSRFGATDVVVLPSLWAETFSLTLREAWAHRRPVIASAVGALSEALGAGDARGLSVPPGDVGAWSAAFRRLTSDRALFERLTGPFGDEPRDAAFDRTTALYESVR